jgi:hypothetical protein
MDKSDRSKCHHKKATNWAHALDSPYSIPMNALSVCRIIDIKLLYISSVTGLLYVSDLREKHRIDLERLTLTSQPLRTLALFALAIGQSIKSTCLCVLKDSARLKFLVLLVASACTPLLLTNGPHEKHVQELLWYIRFGLWWVILGVASSIGLGSGLHTFVLYLGPHIALFTIKAVHCGRTDLKSAPYDTILLKMRPSWLEKDCLEFGPPMYQETIPFSKILHEVHLEAVLWGIGTALGELPPYFLSRAGCVLLLCCYSTT